MLVELTCSYCKKNFLRKKKDIKTKSKKYYCDTECKRLQEQIDYSDEYTIVRDMHSRAKRRARRDNIFFDLPIEYVKYLWESQDGYCALSGEKLKFGATVYERDHGGNTASLDRKDSSGGYTVDNVQIIHKDIQRMKMDLPEPTFVEWVHKIARHTPIDSLAEVGYNEGVSEVAYHDAVPF